MGGKRSNIDRKKINLKKKHLESSEVIEDDKTSQMLLPEEWFGFQKLHIETSRKVEEGQ